MSSTQQQTQLSLNRTVSSQSVQNTMKSQLSSSFSEISKSKYGYNFSKNRLSKINNDYQRAMQLKQQYIVIKQRKALIPKVPDPQIINYFNDLKLIKTRENTKLQLQLRIAEKKKQLAKLKELYTKSTTQFEQKSQIFKEKSTLQRVLYGKMEIQLNKTKERFREAEFNKVIIKGARKVLYYKLAEILFNQKTRNIFNILQNIKFGQKIDEDNLGICLGYLGVFITIIGQISGARLWINFKFRGSRSTIKAADSNMIILHPKETRLNQGLKLLNEQLFQIMHDTMGLKIDNPNNFYQLCQELSKQIMSV